MVPNRLISSAVARRFLVVRHFLVPPRSLPAGPEGVMAAFARLGSVQFDPLDVTGRNHDLVLLVRVADYQRTWTDDLLYRERKLYETYNKGLSLVPTAELPYYRVSWDRYQKLEAGVLDEHALLVTELLDRIRSNGPMTATDIEPRAAIDWFWRPTNQVRAILEALALSGILGLSRRDGNRRVYDLVERLFPADLLAQRLPEDEQRRHKLLSRYRAHGLLGTSGRAEVWPGLGSAAERSRWRRELVEREAIVPITVDGVKGERFVVAEELPILDRATREVESGSPPGGDSPGVSFLAPLDPLVWDRDFLRTLWGFDYLWEVYVPLARRRWGYYVLPVLWGDRFVGRIEPRIDRRADRLHVLGLWWEQGFDPLGEAGFAEAFADALEAHRRFGGVARVVLPGSRTGRGLARVVADRTGRALATSAR